MVNQKIPDHVFDAGLKDLIEFLKIPSVSADPAYKGEVTRAANWLADKLQSLGFEASVVPTAGHPLVVGGWKGAPGAQTVLVYGHYDVQPAKMEDGWTSHPFEPKVVEGFLRCRGASDDKGQLMCQVLGAGEYLKRHGGLPANVVFVFEGEEECGSENLYPYIAANKGKLMADVVMVSDTAQFGPGQPALGYGLRGLLYTEIKLTGPRMDLHSGIMGGVVLNPANALARLVASFHDQNGKVAIAGFYDDVSPLEAWEREQWARLGHDEKALAADLGVESLWGEAGYTALERMWARPTLDVNGIWSGWIAEGAKTVIPSVASAKISMRLVPGQDPDKIYGLFCDHVRRNCPVGIKAEVKNLHGARPVLLPTRGKFVDAAKLALKNAWGVEPVFIREGGSIPVVENFSTTFGAPVILMGFGRPDDRAHGPDERFNMEDFRKGILAVLNFWYNIKQ